MNEFDGFLPNRLTQLDAVSMSIGQTVVSFANYTKAVTDRWFNNTQFWKSVCMANMSHVPEMEIEIFEQPVPQPVFIDSKLDLPDPNNSLYFPASWTL